MSHGGRLYSGRRSYIRLTMFFLCFGFVCKVRGLCLMAPGSQF